MDNVASTIGLPVDELREKNFYNKEDKSYLVCTIINFIIIALIIIG